MPNTEELLKKVNMQEIAEQGAKVYASIKGQFEPHYNGKFLVIDIGSGDTYIADESSAAVEQARKAHPDTVFYVVKIGYAFAEALADMGVYAHGMHY